MLDEDCESAVCDVAVGACVPESTVLYASPTGGDGTNCELDNPCSLETAFDLANATRSVIKLAPGAYTAGVIVDGKKLTVFARGVTINTPSDSRTFQVNNDGELRLIGVAIRNANPGGYGMAVSCERSNEATATPVVDLEDVDIEARQPIVANPCTMSLRNSRIRALDGSYTVQVFGLASPARLTIERSIFPGGGGFLALGNATLKLRNSVVANQLGSTQAFSGNGRIDVSFSTIINSPTKCSTDIWPPCSPGGTSGNGACFDNSIIVNLAAEAAPDTVTGQCVANYTLIYPQATALLGANNRIGANPMLVDPVAGDYRLSSTSPAIDAADPAAANDVDYDGTMRPQGQRPDQGAFELKF